MGKVSQDRLDSSRCVEQLGQLVQLDKASQVRVVIGQVSQVTLVSSRSVEQFLLDGGDRPWDGGLPIQGWWVTILEIVGDHPQNGQ